MRRWIPFCLLVALVVVATRPLWWMPAPFFFTADGFSHLFKIFEFDRALRQGMIYPRWAPDMIYGYGYPAFNFYSPLVYFVAEIFHLVGLGIPDAIKATFVVTIVIAAAGSFALGTELFRDEEEVQTVGLLTAVAYVCFPYFLLDIYVRGGFAEGLAMALLPWSVWSLKRTLWQRRNGSMVLTGLFSAGLVLAHNLTTLLAAPFLAAYILFELSRLPVSMRFAALWRVSMALLLGVLLSAVYWLPALSEMSLVAISRGSVEFAALVRFNSFALTEVILPSLLYQYHYLAPYPLPLVPMGLGMLALLMAVIQRRGLARRGTVIFFGAAALVGVVLLLDWAGGLWLAVPFLRSVQFPWRLSIFIGLSMAVVIGSLPRSILTTCSFRSIGAQAARFQDSLNLGIAAGIAGLLIWAGLADLTLSRLNNPRGEITLAQLARFEVNTPETVLGSMNEYLPLAVEKLPSRYSARVPSGVSPVIALAEYSAARRAFTVSTPQPMSISMHTFYFPDWQAMVDEKPAPIYPSTPMGLLTVDIPAGVHRVAVTLTDTLDRRIGVWMSGLGALAIITLTVGVIRRGEREAGAVLVVVGLVALGFAMTTSVALASQLAALQSIRVTVSSELDLIGLRIEAARLESDHWHIAGSPSRLHLNVFWQVKQPVEDEPVVWRLIDGAGREWTRRAQLPRYGAGFAATWVPNEIVEDHYDLPLGAGMPGGRYALQVARGREQGYATVSSIELETGSAPAAAEPPIGRRITARVGDRIQFLGYDMVAPPRPGQDLRLTLYWKADRQATEDWTGFIHLIDHTGNLVAQHDGLTDDGFFPTTLWTPGEIVPDQRDVSLASDVEPGLYRLVAGLYRLRTLERLPVTVGARERSPDDVIDLGELKIVVHSTARPAHMLDVSLGSTIRLAGYDWYVTREKANLKLYWQARTRVDADYKVFVHVLDEPGELVAQVDRLPADGKYPTRIWDADESVLDAYVLPLDKLSAGRYKIVVGMYAPETGERLTVVDASGRELRNRQVEAASFEVSKQ